MNDQRTAFLETGLKPLVALAQQRAEPLSAILTEAGLDGPFELLSVQIASHYQPQPVGVAHLFKRYPYTNPERFRTMLEQVARKGWLDRVSEGAYAISEQGQQINRTVLELLEHINEDVSERVSVDLDRVQALLERLRAAAANSSLVADKTALALDDMFMPPANASALCFVRRHLVGLFAYRDDAHVAAWGPHAVDGYVWEAFSFVWEGEACTAEELVEKLPYRFYDLAAYSSALETLQARGWLTEADGQFEITAQGEYIRQQAEDLTNEAYDVIFEALSPAEMHELLELLETLALELQPAVVAA